MAYSKGLNSNSGGSQRGRPYVLILLITFGAALLGVMVLHKLRERRIYNLLVTEKDYQLHTLQLLLQKERDRNKEMRGKNEEMKGKIYALRSQKMDLARTVVEIQSTLDSLKDEQKLMESALEEKQSELRMMQQKQGDVEQGDSEIISLRENIKHKEAEIKDLKRRLEIPLKNNPVSINDDPTNHPVIVTENGKMAAQAKTENGNKGNESSGESANAEGDNKRVTNEDASETQIAAEIKDEFRNDEKLDKENEDPQEDGGAKDMEVEVVDGREKKAIREEVAQLENNTDAGGKNVVHVKQLRGVKRKHGHASRTRGKHGRAIVKNKLMENSGTFESHGGLYMDRRVGRNSDEEKFAREDKSQAKLQKPEIHENRDVNNMTKNHTNHQETKNGINIHPEKQGQAENTWSENHEDTAVQQNWSARHINKADMNAEQTESIRADKGVQQTKSNLFHNEHEDLGVLDVQKQEEDAIHGGNEHEDVVEVLDEQKHEKDATDEDDNENDVKESQSEFEDEKEEYKEETDQSEFHSGL